MPDRDSIQFFECSRQHELAYEVIKWLWITLSAAKEHLVTLLIERLLTAWPIGCTECTALQHPAAAEFFIVPRRRHVVARQPELLF